MTRPEQIVHLMRSVRDELQRCIRESATMQQFSQQSKELQVQVAINFLVNMTNYGEPVGEMDFPREPADTQMVPSPFPTEAPDWLKGMCVSLGEVQREGQPYPADYTGPMSGVCPHGFARAIGPCGLCESDNQLGPVAKLTQDTCDPLITRAEAHRYWPAEEAAQLLKNFPPRSRVPRINECDRRESRRILDYEQQKETAKEQQRQETRQQILASTRQVDLSKAHWHVLVEDRKTRAVNFVYTTDDSNQANAWMAALNNCCNTFATMPLRPCRGNCPKVEL